MDMSSLRNGVATNHEGSVLVFGEDSLSQSNIVTFLSEHGMLTRTLSHHQDLLHALPRNEPELIILNGDIGRDGGFDFVRQIRSRSAVPLFVLAGQNHDSVDRIIGLELGADEYLTEPLCLRELLARVRSTFRRRAVDRLASGRQYNRRYSFSEWLLDEHAHQLRNPAGIPVPLTKSEFNLLGAFVQAPRRALTREHLLQATRVHEDVYDRSIDVQVLRLRRKLEQDTQARNLIRTERGVGYVLDSDVKLLLPGDGPAVPSVQVGSRSGSSRQHAGRQGALILSTRSAAIRPA